MPFCPYCGHVIEQNAAYCPSCGHRISAQTEPTSGSNVPPPPYPGNAPVAAAFGDADRKALRWLMIASIIFLATLVVGYSTGFFANRLASLVTVTPSTVGKTPVVHLSSAFYTYLDVSLLVSAVVEIFALILVWSSFRALATVDRARFRVPAILTIVLLVALPILYIGVAVIYSGLPAVLNYVAQQQATNSTVTPTVLPTVFGRIFAGLGVTALGGLIGLIGVIGGVMLGLWRVGGRYDSTLIKVAAILIIIPLIDIVVPILLLIGIWQARGRVASMPT